MVRIPKLPDTYQVGDVVNGHVLDERGNWVPTSRRDTRAAVVSTVPGLAEGRRAARVGSSEAGWQREASSGQASPVSGGKPLRGAGTGTKPATGSATAGRVIVAVVALVLAGPVLRTIVDVGSDVLNDGGPGGYVADVDPGSWDEDPVVTEDEDESTGGSGASGDVEGALDFEVVEHATWIEGEYVSAFALIEASGMEDEALHYVDVTLRNAHGEVLGSAFRAIVAEPGSEHAFSWTMQPEVDVVEPFTVDARVDSVFEADADDAVPEHGVRDLAIDADGRVTGTLLLDSSSAIEHPSMLVVARDEDGTVIDVGRLSATTAVVADQAEVPAEGWLFRVPSPGDLDVELLELYPPS